MEAETTEHIVLRCRTLRPDIAEDAAIDIEGALGFAGEDGRVDERRVMVTKSRLEDWWKRARDE